MAIKMKSYVEDSNLLEGNTPSIISRALLGTLGALAVVYVFLLGSMVVNIIERKSIEAEARTLSNQVSDLEQNYLELSNKVDLSYSHSLGFKEIQPTFAPRKSLGSIKAVHNEI